MKINICYTELNEVADHINISPFAKPESNFHPVDIRNIDEIVCDDEVEHIDALDVLNYFSLQEVLNMAENWIKKLAPKGTLTLTFNDYWEIARRTIVGLIEYKDINDILFGKQSQPYDIKRSAIPLHWFKNWILSKGVKLNKCRLEGYVVVMEVEKL